MPKATISNFRKPQATKPVCNRIAIVFNFDDTLASDTFNTLLSRLGLDKGDTAKEWDQQIEVSESQRVMNLAPANYQEDSELMRSLTLAVESLCKQLSLRQLSSGE